MNGNLMINLDMLAVNTPGLHDIANCKKSSRIADVVFLHGLGGDSHGTWNHTKHNSYSNFFWPAELGEDLPECGIWTAGYPAGVSASIGEPGMIIEKRAGNLAQVLANKNVGDRPIIFVTHSLGGLVVKALLVGSQVQADKDRKEIARQTRGIVFCGTPHRGSGYATAASILGSLIGGAQGHVKEMKSGHQQLDILHDQFVEWQRIHSVPVCSYAENIGLFRKGWFRMIPLGLVVPRDSANPNIAGHTVRDLDEDHLSMVKPKNRESDVYAGVLRFVKDCLVNKGDPAVDSVASKKLKKYPHLQEDVEGVIADLAKLSPTQRNLIGIVAKSKGGIYMGSLAAELSLNRSETVYRVKDLVNQRILKTTQMTDEHVGFSDLMYLLKKATPTDFEKAMADIVKPSSSFFES